MPAQALSSGTIMIFTLEKPWITITRVGASLTSFWKVIWMQRKSGHAYDNMHKLVFGKQFAMVCICP